jgi:multidrug efflux system membrane fusion protein
MRAEGKTESNARSKRLSLAVVGVAAVLALLVYYFDTRHPSTDDASIDADVVHVAPAVGGRIITIAVRENARVRKGDLLLQIDPTPYRMQVAQAEADLALARAQLDTQRRVVSTQHSNALVAADQTQSASANYALAARTSERLRPLTEAGYVPKQQLDQAQVTEHDAGTALRQARELQSAAVTAIDTVAAGEAAVSARIAAVALAHRFLDDTTVRATHDGLIVGLTVSTGEFVIPGQSLFTLINAEDWYASANLRENELDAVETNECATVYSMTDRRIAIKGHVDSIGWGVLDQDRINIPRSVPYVERDLNWVRVAQRFPVRVKLDNPPASAMRLGASAAVEIGYGAACH